ncbi:hypothetical protein [Bifidobacterium parmae]|uniref:Uncharacterized protein n=1 Tax=Bifidobacterium parmae TaxID=361854 RepID=A0A2N5J4B6_9BIFI|nr:hypothetical protein [Bifidobacterium parmae]PLS29037.1 hypothetical protein Uis4E_0770 [Bifidobacterium parmae]
MTELNTASIARVAAAPAVREAAREAARLIALWPLTDAMRMDNDAKYGENLQVRVTRAFARILTGEDVTVPDAEYVYEGADAIPGRPQTIVDALLAANDAYDAIADFSDTGDATLVDDVAADLGVTWDDAASVRVHGTLDAVEAAVNDGTFDAGEYAVADGGSDGTGDGGASGGAAGAADAAGAAAMPVDDDAFEPSPALVDAMAHRFAAALTVCDALLAAVEDSGAGDAASAPVAADTPVDAAAVRAVLPLLLVVNELREQISVPRICLTDVQVRDLLAARAAALADAATEAAEGATAGVGDAATLDATAAFVAPLAAAEWAKHREDVLWDPAAAKKKAKEEDEKRNKAALAAKFAHVKNDNTETVEL